MIMRPALFAPLLRSADYRVIIMLLNYVLENQDLNAWRRILQHYVRETQQSVAGNEACTDLLAVLATVDIERVSFQALKQETNNCMFDVLRSHFGSDHWSMPDSIVALGQQDRFSSSQFCTEAAKSKIMRAEDVAESISYLIASEHVNDSLRDGSHGAHADLPAGRRADEFS